MQLNSSEWKVMNALWRKHPATAREVLDQMVPETAWAYTTLKTLLTRLVEKGAVREEKQGNASVYTPLLEQSEARTEAVSSLVERVFDGAAASLLQHLLAEKKLSRRDRDELSAMLQKSAAEKGKKR